jgi:hypothetical protein
MLLDAEKRLWSHGNRSLLTASAQLSVPDSIVRRTATDAVLARTCSHTLTIKMGDYDPNLAWMFSVIERAQCR